MKLFYFIYLLLYLSYYHIIKLSYYNLFYQIIKLANNYIYTIMNILKEISIQ